MSSLFDVTDTIFRIGGINLNLSEFNPSGDNTLYRYHKKIGTESSFDIVKWDKYGVEIYRTNEGCFHNKQILGPYKYSWDELKDSAEKGIDKGRELKISPQTVQRLLMLRDLECRVGENPENINVILRGEVTYQN